MAYLGTPPQSGFITTAKQRVTSSTNDYVDLDHSISSIADVIVFVNFVKQDTTNLTLTTSTRITLGGTLVSSDIVEIHYLGKAVNTQTPATGTVTNDMLAGSIANSKLVNSSITLNGSAVSLGGSATVGGNNTPIFYAHNQNSQTISTGTHTVVQFDTDSASNDFDPDSKFNTSNYRFTPAVSGYYLLYTQIALYDNYDFDNFRCTIRKNGGAIVRARIVHKDNGTINAMTIVNSDTDDYFDCEVYHDKGSNLSLTTGYENTYFTGFKIIT
jgi:hypothetical protein